MGEKLEFTQIENENIKPLTHQRILWLMGIVSAVSVVLGAVFGSLSFGLGILIGGLLSFLNYYWLKISLRRVFEGVIEGKKPGVFGAQYFLRYMVFGLLLAIIYLTKTVSVVAVILGLSSFAFAVVIEGFLRIFSSFSNKREV
jgi:hypothetical protein